VRAAGYARGRISLEFLHSRMKNVQTTAGSSGSSWAGCSERNPGSSGTCLKPPGFEVRSWRKQFGSWAQTGIVEPGVAWRLSLLKNCNSASRGGRLRSSCPECWFPLKSTCSGLVRRAVGPSGIRRWRCWSPGPEAWWAGISVLARMAASRACSGRVPGLRTHFGMLARKARHYSGFSGEQFGFPWVGLGTVSS